MTLPGGGQYDDVVRWLAELDAQDAINSLRQLAMEAEKTDKTMNNVSKRTKSYSSSTAQATTATQQQEQAMNKAEKSAKSYGYSLDLVRIALGAITAMVVFRTIQFIEESMRKAITTAEDFETSLYRLVNVERILSETGTEITFDELNAAIARVKEQLPIFSETDITKQISLIGIMTKDLGLSAGEIEQLALAIGVLNIRSADTEDLMTTTNKVLQSIVSKGPGVGQLGVKFSEAAVTAKAVELGYIQAGESLSDLADEQRDFVVGQAKVAIAIENVSGEVETLNDYMELNTAKIQTGEAAWEDFLKIVGQAILPVKVLFIQFLIPLLEVSERNLKLLIIGFVNLTAAVTALGTVMYNVMQGNLTSLRDFSTIFQEIRSNLAEQFFPEEALEGIDTATGAVKQFGEEVESLEEIEGFEDLAEDLEKLQQKIEDTELDFQIDQARELEDYNIKVNRIIEDYAIKRRRIQEDAADKIADANQKHRQKELNDEAKFQEQMRQLREKFLFNLEDALRERDARQVLRLQRQYEMDKTALQNEYALRQKEADQQHQEDLARIREERDDRLAELAEEERIRLQREAEDFALQQQRAAEDHAREMEQLRQQINERLMEFARAIGEEYNLNQEGVDAIYSLLQQYYGPGGYFDGLYDYSYNSMVARAQEMLASINMIVAQAQMSLSTLATPTGMIGGRTPSAPTRSASLNIGPQAEGGTYLANRPTTATFGEAGPELAAFIPLRKLGSPISASAGMLGGMNGELGIEIILSPDLEARIVKKSQDMTAEVFTKVTRSKG